MARVLVVEDNSEVRILLRETLERAGHGVEEAADGVQAIAIYRRQPADVVVVDIIMPQKDGIATIRELRRDFPGARIIAISGGGVVGAGHYLTTASIFGADRTLEKPFEGKALLEDIRELLASR
jgi:CheY-like chemotaxis protein